MPRYDSLLEPGRIGSLELRNRMVLTSMGVNLAEEDGTCGDRIVAFHEQHAQGGAAMIIMGVTGVGWPAGGNLPRQVAISQDRFIPGLSRVAERVHAHGAKLAVQLHFGGLVSTEDMAAGRPVLCPSYPKPAHGDFGQDFLEDEPMAGPGRGKPIEFKEMDADDIARVIDWFTQGAVRAREAGADGIELHGGHGYLLSSFISPYSNRRADEYGGTLENRVRLTTEIVAGIRGAVGNDFPLWCKIDSQEFEQPEGITIDEAVRTARLLEKAGVDAITVSSYHDATRGVLHSGSHTPQAPEHTVPNAARIKAGVGIPVIASGRIEPERADRHIRLGRFDFLSMGRKLLADPELPRKISEGRAQDIRPCIYCYCCISQIYKRESVKCAVRPETAFETERVFAPTRDPKKIVVIGGGPAGMEAARRLCDKGHRVTLLEQSDALGGSLQFAALAYPPNGLILEWLKRQIGASRADVRLGTRATPEVLARFAPDEVVVATGAAHPLPPIPGAERDNVLSGDDMRHLVLGGDEAAQKALTQKFDWKTRAAMRAAAMTGAAKSAEIVRQATRTWMPLGKRIVVIGGELVGLELAEFLAERGRQVTVVDDVPKFGRGLYIVRRMRLLDELRKLGVKLLPKASGIAIEDKAVTYTNENGQQRLIAADHVIVAKGVTADRSLAKEFEAQGFSVHEIGDCTGVGYIEGAIEDAADLAQRL